MDNVSSTAKIYWTEDYGKFHFLHGNRDLSQTKVNKLSRDVENGLNLFQYCPILVNKDYFIIDGQHRFYVCKKKKLKIYYCIVPEVTLAEIAKINNNQNRWKMVDFMNCYIDAGSNSEHYKTLKAFVEKYHVTISMGVSMLFTGVAANGSRNLDVFRDGEFVANYFNEATSTMDMALEYQPYAEAYTSREFVVALQKLAKGGKFSQEAMIQKLEKHGLRIEKKANSKEYMAHFEDLFNFKNSIRQRIY